MQCLDFPEVILPDNILNILKWTEDSWKKIKTQNKIIIYSHLFLQKILEVDIFLLQVAASTHCCVIMVESSDSKLTQKWTKKLPHNEKMVQYLIF